MLVILLSVATELGRHPRFDHAEMGYGYYQPGFAPQYQTMGPNSPHQPAVVYMGGNPVQVVNGQLPPPPYQQQPYQQQVQYVAYQ